MARTHRIFPNLYRDSVALMQISSRLAAAPEIAQAALVMATPANIALLIEAGLLDSAPKAGANDIVLAVEGDDGVAIESAFAAAQAALTEEPDVKRGEGTPREPAPRSIEDALKSVSAGNLALVSCPGDYAGAEAFKALRLGLDVMLFSDNVPLETEIALKELAAKQDLLVMGPDCGTAIVNGVPLGFANVVARGDIGVVAASGTGLQQVTCLVDRWGRGISQAIGTGGRDLNAKVGGRTMIQGIEALAGDPETTVIVLISKPPAAAVAARVLDVAKSAGKPVVVNFLGARELPSPGDGVHFAPDLESAAYIATALSSDGKPPVDGLARHPLSGSEVSELAAELGGNRKFVRGLYSGGTFSYEAMLILEPMVGAVWSSSPLSPESKLNDPWSSTAHTVVDLGDDTFTRGRPHPMIDHRLRNERILREAQDPETAVILLDVVLGYGAHPDPATEIVPAIERAREAANGSAPLFVASVTGTARDPQNLERQEQSLRDAGVILAGSNAQAARLAGDIACAIGGADS